MGFWNKLKAMLGLGGAEQGERAPDGTEAERAGRGGAGAAPAQARRAQARATAASAKPRPADPYDARGILGLSEGELRRRALEINPHRTAWIGRVDTIPPQSDERTALIDRGLILRGLLTEAQIAEIHRIGDLWLKHHDAVRLASALAARSADEAIAQQERERLARKEEKRRQSEERRKQRAEAVARRRAEDIIYLGLDVSAGLADRRSQVESLAGRGLPVLSTPADVARALDIPVPRLRWLCFHGEAVERPHYVYFEVPKRSGGTRLLAAPHASLAAAQAWILREILDKLPVEEPAHGFVKGRSTVTNARPHARRDVVVNLDLSEFFPTITFPRVRGVFHRLGYSPAVATVLALLCTEAPRRAVEYDGQRLWVAVGDRALPQGACTSPAISNQVARKLDRRLAGMCARAGFVYTRYADDLTFSAPPGKRGDIAMLLARVRHIVMEEGFAIHPEKGRVQRAGGRQVVTGVVVNDRPSAPREEVRRLRAILHAAKKTGLAAQNRRNVPDFEAHLRGRIAYVQMIDREKAAPLLAALDALTG
ncbi:reverse transcriptase family protein [Sorangium cellulosum]|uniref:RNA-directed DNA polymerase n=2 Tax=Sorangium cellulosum TaxID=56 RepID=S4XQW5_SORCE|nr:reverse transcriptase family protein [Sorangium cellulosum]AGP32968.1 RNA-directed DNA polymerase [Sorangium cellulosum So0157-2]